MANNNNNSELVPQARQALDNMKYEIANELGINYSVADKGSLTSRENGYVGGYMVKKMIEQQEQAMSGSSSNTTPTMKI